MSEIWINYGLYMEYLTIPIELSSTLIRVFPGF